MQNYQLTILINNTVDEKVRTSLLDSLNKDLGSKNKSEVWGVRGLAYQINHQDKAFYVHFNFEADPGTIPALDRKLKLNEDIIRYLLIKNEIPKSSPVPAPKAAASAEAKEVETVESEVAAPVEVTEAPEEKETPKKAPKATAKKTATK
jgi:small subunit ribosomal protein S6